MTKFKTKNKKITTEKNSNFSMGQKHTESLDNCETNEEVYNYFMKHSTHILQYFCNENEISGVTGALSVTTGTKASILDDYLKTSKQNYRGKIIKNIEIEICKSCKQSCQILTDSVLVCQLCGFAEETIINCDKQDFSDLNLDKIQYTYDRRHHFKDLINQVQGKESTNISNETIARIRKEIIKHHIPLSEVGYLQIRTILKKLGLSKCYEHSMNILNKINPSRSILFTKEIEDRLFLMFDSIQEPFILFCPQSRKNMVNYNYILYKFCQILKLEHLNYSEFFTLLKSRTKLAQLEIIWKKIIIYIQKNKKNDGIDWQFYSSI